MDDDLGFTLALSGRGLRGRASDSINELRATLNSSPRRRTLGSHLPTPRHSSSSLSKSTSRRLQHRSLSSPRDLEPGSLQNTRLSDNRALDNYNNAVDRLRTLLLSNSNQASTLPGRGRRSSEVFSQNGQHEAPFAMEDTYTYKQSPRLPLTTSVSKVHTEPNSQQLLQIINSQSAYIQQLEGENKYCREELHGLKGRTEAIVAENVKLNDEMKDMLIKTALEDSPFRQDEQPSSMQGNQERRSNQRQHPQAPDRLMFAQWSEDLEKLKKMHSMRVKRLEDQLASTKSELVNYEKQCNDLKVKLRMAESVNLLSRKDSHIKDGLCVRCAQEEAVMTIPSQPANSTTIHRITEERDDLVSRLTANQAAKEEAEVREAEAYNQVQQSIQLVEQAQLERTEALVQTEQAKEDIVRLQSRMADMVTEQQEKLHLEREATRRESQEEIAQLNHKVGKLSEELSAMTNQLERVTREKVDITSELDQAKMQIMQHEVQITKVSEDTRVSATTAKVQRDEAMRQLERLRASMESELRSAKQEKSRVKNDLSDVRRRLQQAEKDASSSREECIRLVEKLNAAEREASILRLSHESVEKGNKDALRMVRHRAEKKEQDLKQTIHDMEAKHSLAVNELENMLSDQQALITKLRGEGRILTEKLESGTNKYRSELRQLRQVNGELVARSERLSQQHNDMEIQCVEHGKLHHRMKTRLQQMEEQNNKNAKQIFELLQKQTSLMQERQVLSKEVEFLRSHGITNAPSDLNRSETNWLNSDVDKLKRSAGSYGKEAMVPSHDQDR
ncbi:serologically defined colon cancer antigen 8 homolog isoform X2 [Lytechinus pictus]|uniref:serologically defined colon cancer antigen 8 homolog isoform X2 n=1 Tax=Lytechinus pictus TaxID=7653 RepID=UPI0030B9C5F7